VAAGRPFGGLSVRGGAGVYRGVARLRDKLFSLSARGSFGHFGRRSVIQLPVRLSGEKKIWVGDDVFVGAGSWLQVVRDSDRQQGGIAIEIGSGTSIAGSCVLSAVSRISLGRSVLLARNVYIADHMHAYEDPGVPVLDQGLTRVSPVEIGDGAWLGQNVVITPGVRVGRGAVVGANSVVRDDVPDFAVAVGAPARVVRQLDPDAAQLR
jgi:acetyltransferase-like isoleucine patch superfamily enzyme